MDPLAKLDRTRAALRVLLFIYEHEGTNLTNVIKGTPHAGQKAIYSALETLLELGLVRQEFEKRVGGERRFFMTEKGKKVAELLAKIRDILSA